MVTPLDERTLNASGRQARPVTTVGGQLLCVGYRMGYDYTLEAGQMTTSQRRHSERAELFELFERPETGNLYIVDYTTGLYDQFMLQREYPDWNGRLLCELRRIDQGGGLYSSTYPVIGYGVAEGCAAIAEQNERLSWLVRTLPEASDPWAAAGSAR